MPFGVRWEHRRCIGHWLDMAIHVGRARKGKLCWLKIYHLEFGKLPISLTADPLHSFNAVAQSGCKQIAQINVTSFSNISCWSNSDIILGTRRDTTRIQDQSIWTLSRTQWRTDLGALVVLFIQPFHYIITMWNLLRHRGQLFCKSFLPITEQDTKFTLIHSMGESLTRTKLL